jgi:hypothetical protein
MCLKKGAFIRQRATFAVEIAGVGQPLRREFGARAAMAGRTRLLAALWVEARDNGVECHRRCHWGASGFVETFGCG